MNHNDSFRAALSECESAATTRGHTLGSWQTVTEEMATSMCVVCNKLAWVNQLRDELHPRVGGSVLEQDCSGYWVPNELSSTLASLRRNRSKRATA
jgi:hypothetical protein